MLLLWLSGQLVGGAAIGIGSGAGYISTAPINVRGGQWRGGRSGLRLWN